MKTSLKPLAALLLLCSATPALRADPETEKAVAEIFSQMSAAYAALQTMSADFTYTVTSDKRKQVVEGSARLMKPNYARLTFTRMAEPAFPNLIGCDGQLAYTYVPKNFRGGHTPVSTPINPEFRTPADPAADGLDLAAARMANEMDRIPTNRTFEPGPHDPQLAARQASGLAKGGLIEAERAQKDGRNLRLWDSIALQTFFSFRDGISYLYQFKRNPENFRIEDPRMVEGAACQVISYYFPYGTIEGGAKSPFTHRLYVSPAGLIVRYELHFYSGGQPGLQVMQLRNIRLNEPMTAESFAFAPPAGG